MRRLQENIHELQFCECKAFPKPISGFSEHRKLERLVSASRLPA